MMKSTGSVRQDLEREIQGLRSLHHLILMYPGEVSEFTWGYSEAQHRQVQKMWVAIGVVTRRFLEALRTAPPNEVRHEITAVATFREGTYGVISTQLGTWQHRFVLPLFERQVIELFTDTSRSPLGLSFSTNDGDVDSVLFCDVFSKADRTSFATRCQVLSDDQYSEFAVEHSSVMWDMMLPHFLPSLFESEVVSTVELSGLVPSSDSLGYLFDFGYGDAS